MGFRFSPVRALPPALEDFKLFLSLSNNGGVWRAKIKPQNNVDSNLLPTRFKVNWYYMVVDMRLQHMGSSLNGLFIVGYYFKKWRARMKGRPTRRHGSHSNSIVSFNIVPGAAYRSMSIGSGSSITCQLFNKKGSSKPAPNRSLQQQLELGRMHASGCLWLFLLQHL